jgi:hypothetical protein
VKVSRWQQIAAMVVPTPELPSAALPGCFEGLACRVVAGTHPQFMRGAQCACAGCGCRWLNSTRTSSSPRPALRSSSAPTSAGSQPRRGARCAQAPVSSGVRRDNLRGFGLLMLGHTAYDVKALRCTSGAVSRCRRGAGLALRRRASDLALHSRAAALGQLDALRRAALEVFAAAARCHHRDTCDGP